MSCFTKTIGESKYYCLDNFYGGHNYGYVEMTEEERNSPNPWELLDYKTLEWRGGSRKVLMLPPKK